MDAPPENSLDDELRIVNKRIETFKVMHPTMATELERYCKNKCLVELESRHPAFTSGGPSKS